MPSSSEAAASAARANSQPNRVSPQLPSWARQSFRGDLFSSGPWFAHFSHSALGPDETPAFLTIPAGKSDAEIVFPLKQTRGAVFPRCRILESMANYYSGGYGPVCDHALAGRTLENALFFLARGASAFDLLRLGPLDKSTELALAAEASLRRSGFSTRWHFAFGNWYADVRGLDYHAYLERAPSSFPATCEKRRRAFLRRNIGELQIVSDLVGIERYIEEYLEVYRSSWKIPEPFPDFIPGLIRLAAERGWLRLGIARVDGKPVAAQVWFVVGSKALIYKVAYDERFSKLSIGSILTAELIRRAIDTDNVSELDFLSGDDAYKAKWMFARRERHALWAFNLRRPRGALTWVRHLAGARIASFRSAMARRTELVSSPVK